MEKNQISDDEKINGEKTESKKTDEISSPDRREFLGRMGGVTAALAAASAIGLEPIAGSKGSEARASAPIIPGPRRNAAFRIRRDTAEFQRSLPLPRNLTNGDETLFANRIGSFSKTLPHTSLGEADPMAYDAFLRAAGTGRPVDFESIPGGPGRLVNPQGGLIFSLDGADSHHTALATPPAFSSAWEAGEMVEVYWQALTRDVPFVNYGTDSMIAQAAAELSRMTDFRGPKSGGAVTPATIFRGETPGDLTGPYVSQFLLKDVPYGAMTIVQKYRVPNAGDDHLTSYNDWLNNQRGSAPTTSNSFDPTPRYLRNGRDLGEYVHRDFTYQAFLNAALILLGFGGAANDESNPYSGFARQAGFVSFGGPYILDLVARAANAGLKAAWFHKWFVHRRLRPEAFAGRIHNRLTGAANYPIHSDVLNSQVIAAVLAKYGTYLLPMAYPEGCPAHPAYPAGHASIAGACSTILKAFFKESLVIPSPVEASADGLTLNPFTGSALTVGGELNKLAANIAISRDTAGVHWRTDGVEGVRLGEAVAIAILEDERATYSEDFVGFQLTRLDGTTTNI